MDEPTQPVSKEKKTIYQAGYAEVFFKNFLAGFGKALGFVFIYFILFFIFYKMFYPQIASQMTGLTNMVTDLKNVQTIQPNTIDPNEINQLIDQLTPTKK